MSNIHFFLYVHATPSIIHSRFLKKYSLDQLQNMHKTQQQIFLPIIMNKGFPFAQPCNNPSLQQTFLLAQQKMNLPNIIPLFKIPYLTNDYNQKLIAAYFPEINAIAYSFMILKILSPTLICNALLHELRHSQQHLSGINLIDNSTNIAIESDADRFAIHTMRCFVCCHLIQRTAFDTSSGDGYFCKSDYEPYLQATLEKNQRCKAHQKFSQKDLCNINATIDCNCGQLHDRLPKKVEPLPFFQNFYNAK